MMRCYCWRNGGKLCPVCLKRKAKTLLCVTLTNGTCGLSTDTTNEIMRREGTRNVAFIRLATQAQVDWIRAMGGHVPPNGIVSKHA